MGTKISELSEATSILGDDVLPIVNNAATKKVKVSTILKETSSLIKITADTAKGATVTLTKNYKVGAGVLDVYINGERLIKSSDEAGTDGHYSEVGDKNTVSNTIKLTSDWNLEENDYLEIIVRGEYT